MKPKKYDLTNQSEIDRLINEVTAYMRVSLHNGTDLEGRKFALEALQELQTDKYNVVVYGEGD